MLQKENILNIQREFTPKKFKKLKLDNTDKTSNIIGNNISVHTDYKMPKYILKRENAFGKLYSF